MPTITHQTIPARLRRHIFIKKGTPIQQICDFADIDLNSLENKSRDYATVQQRQAILAFQSRELKLTTSQSAILFKQNHATTIHACRRLDDDLFTKVNSILILTYNKLLEANKQLKQLKPQTT